jgi:ActR/RegA family two-component response regulator
MKNSRRPHLPAAPQASRRSLVVARDFPTLCTLREIMAAADFEVHCAAGAVEVGQLLARYRYDAVIADLDFGTADPGPTLAIVARARQENPTSHLVVVTSAADGAGSVDFARLAAERCSAVRGDVAALRGELEKIVRRPDTAQSPAQEGQSW